MPPTRLALVVRYPLVLTLAAGLLPFGTIFVELYFAMTSFWEVGPFGGGGRIKLCIGGATRGALFVVLTLHSPGTTA